MPLACNKPMLTSAIVWLYFILLEKSYQSHTKKGGNKLYFIFLPVLN